MIKKVLIAGLFLGGGIYLLKKLLPIFKAKSSSLDLETKEYEVKQHFDNKSGGRTNNPNQLGGNQSATNILSMEGSVITNRSGNYNTPRTGKQYSMNNAPL